MEVEWKWCGGFSKNNFKHKLYTTHNLWEGAPLSSSRGLHPNVIFPLDSQMGVPKLGLLMSQNFRRSYISQIKIFLKL
jgi:hypothetical protein